MNKDEKAGLWSERIREFRSSGQTCRDWCTEHQIPVSTMTYWIRKLKNEKNTSVSGEDKEPVFAKLPSESEIVMRDTAQECFLQALFGQNCKIFLDIVAKRFWTLLHVQIGQSCNAPAGCVINQP